MTGETSTGRTGELIACAVLEELGADPVLLRTDGYDIAARWKTTWHRVEVKAASSISKGRNTYQFHTGKGSKKKSVLIADACDIVALVALPERRVLFWPVEEVRTVTVRLPAGHFTPENERESWANVVGLE